MNGMECELKMRATPAILARLRRHPLIAACRGGKAVTRQQRSVYYDTPDLDLQRQGIVLRIRSLGRQRIQTVKSTGDRSAGLFQRREVEARILGDAPNLMPLMESAFAKVFSAPGIAEALRPVFATEVKRTTILLTKDAWEIEVAFDQGRIVSLDGPSGRAEPISEIELELRQGTASDLFTLGRQMQDGVPVRLLTESKSDRGYRLIAGKPARAIKAGRVAIGHDVDAGGAFQHIARSCLQHFLANQDALIEERLPEGIHQLRVALRRLRSALIVFKKFAATPDALRLKEEMRWMLAGLGPARDADVFLAEIVDGATARIDAPGIAALRAHFERIRAEAQEIALARILDPRCGSLILALGAWLEDGDWRSRDPALIEMPITDFAARELTRRYAKLRKDGRHLAKLPPEERHEFRIEVKRMRYACEFFEALFGGKRAKMMIGQLATLQDALGGLNDIAVAHARLREAVGEQADPERAWAAGLIAGFHEARAETLLAGALEAWQAFGTLEKFWDD